MADPAEKAQIGAAAGDTDGCTGGADGVIWRFDNASNNHLANSRPDVGGPRGGGL